MSERTKEQIHDEEIEPLIKLVLAVCAQHGIDFLITFHTPVPDDPGLTVTSCGVGLKSPLSFHLALRMLMSPTDLRDAKAEQDAKDAANGILRNTATEGQVH